MYIVFSPKFDNFAACVDPTPWSLVEMDFTDESNGQVMTSSSDVTGAPTTAMEPVGCTVVEQPQSALTQTCLEPAGPPTASPTPSSEPDQPCTQPHSGESVGHVITGEQHPCPASVNELSRTLEQNLVIPQTPADHHESTQSTPATLLPQQASGVCDLPGVTSSIPVSTPAETMTSHDAATLPQDQTHTVGIQQPPDAVTSPDVQPCQPASEFHHPSEAAASPVTMATEQPMSVPVTDQTEAASAELYPLTTTTSTDAGEHLLLDTVSDHVQSVHVSAATGDVQPSQEQLLPTESPHPAAAECPSETIPGDGIEAELPPASAAQVGAEDVSQQTAVTTSHDDSSQTAAVVQVEDNRREEVQQVEQPNDVIADKQLRREDVVMTTPNDVSGMHHDVSAGSDTDDAPEVIADSLSRDRDVINHHDHQHPSVSHCTLSVCLSVTRPRLAHRWEVVEGYGTILILLD